MSTRHLDRVRLHPLSGARVKHDCGKVGLVVAVDGKGYPLVLFNNPVFVKDCHPHSLTVIESK